MSKILHLIRLGIIILVVILFMSEDLYSRGCVKVNYRTYIPVNAKKYLPDLIKVENEIFPDFILPPYFAALIEHESCVCLKGNSYWARRCWNPKSRLKTKREEGAGFFQITRVFNKTGRVRWDTLDTLRKKYPKQLHNLNWGNIYNRPDLQMKAGLLLWKSNWLRLSKDIPTLDRIAFADAIYNMGFRGLYKRRQVCKLRKNCNPDKWYNNIEKICLRKKKIYGRRVCDIATHHVDDTFNRIDKYIQYYYKEKWIK